MMQSKLIYRFPHGAFKTLSGSFKLLKDVSNFEGFIVSNFEGNMVYGFVEGEFNEVEDNPERDLPIVLCEDAYLNLANEFIHYLQDHEVGKAILSRIKNVDFLGYSVEKLLDQMANAYPNTFCYLFEDPILGTWLGATPETLVEIKNGEGKTMSLAGTKVSTDDQAWGEKELEEQKMVTDFIHSTLLDTAMDVQLSERQEFVAGPVKHLVNYFQFKIDSTNQWNLIKALHPTPAVSGLPRDKALKCIYNFEPHDRKFYAGMIGEVSKNKTHLFVNLRCAEKVNDGLFLYVGGGLTQQSVAKDEWLETERKAQTILRFIK